METYTQDYYSVERTREQRQFAFALMAIAGWCDACGFALFAGLYISFMSGDATQLGINIGSGHWLLVVKIFGAQFLFVLGATLGRYYRLDHREHGRRNMLLVNVGLLGATAIVGDHALTIPAYVFSLLAMGLQNAVMTQEAGVPIGTMITGTLARIGLSIADRLQGGKSDIGDNLGQWAFFVLGALGGGVGYRYLSTGSFWVPAIASGLLIPLAVRLPRMIQAPMGRLS